MKWYPDEIYQTFDELTPEYCLSHGIRALIVDVDNTLIPYEETEPRPGVREWLAKMTEAGIAIAFVTNNHKKRLDTFNASLGFPAYHDSLKPAGRNMKAAMRRMGSTAENTANIGDQILTDIWAGKRLGLRSFLVPPIKDKRDLFTRCKRRIERRIMKKYRKMKGKKEEK